MDVGTFFDQYMHRHILLVNTLLKTHNTGPFTGMPAEFFEMLEFVEK